MPIYNWKCSNDCGIEQRKVLKTRPKLGNCCCGASFVFVSNLSARVVEIRDNGIMPKKVEQLAEVSEVARDHSTKKPDDDIV
jgi:hypothetical protein